MVVSGVENRHLLQMDDTYYPAYSTAIPKWENKCIGGNRVSPTAPFPEVRLGIGSAQAIERIGWGVEE